MTWLLLAIAGAMVSALCSLAPDFRVESLACYPPCPRMWREVWLGLYEWGHASALEPQDAAW